MNEVKDKETRNLIIGGLRGSRRIWIYAYIHSNKTFFPVRNVFRSPDFYIYSVSFRNYRGALLFWVKMCSKNTWTMIFFQSVTKNLVSREWEIRIEITKPADHSATLC